METFITEYLQRLASANTAAHVADIQYETAKEELHDSTVWQNYVEAKNDRTIARDVLTSVVDRATSYVQTTLPLQPQPELARHGGGSIAPDLVHQVFEDVVEQVNSGALDEAGVTVRATTQ
jgi:uncharacterized protein YcbX